MFAAFTMASASSFSDIAAENFNPAHINASEFIANVQVMEVE